MTEPSPVISVVHPLLFKAHPLLFREKCPDILHRYLLKKLDKCCSFEPQSRVLGPINTNFPCIFGLPPLRPVHIQLRPPPRIFDFGQTFTRGVKASHLAGFCRADVCLCNTWLLVIQVSASLSQPLQNAFRVGRSASAGRRSMVDRLPLVRRSGAVPSRSTRRAQCRRRCGDGQGWRHPERDARRHGARLPEKRARGFARPIQDAQMALDLFESVRRCAASRAPLPRAGPEHRP